MLALAILAALLVFVMLVRYLVRSHQRRLFKPSSKVSVRFRRRRRVIIPRVDSRFPPVHIAPLTQTQCPPTRTSSAMNHHHTRSPRNIHLTLDTTNMPCRRRGTDLFCYLFPIKYEPCCSGKTDMSCAPLVLTRGRHLSRV